MWPKGGDGRTMTLERFSTLNLTVRKINQSLETPAIGLAIPPYCRWSKKFGFWAKRRIAIERLWWRNVVVRSNYTAKGCRPSNTMLCNFDLFDSHWGCWKECPRLKFESDNSSHCRREQENIRRNFDFKNLVASLHKALTARACHRKFLVA